MQNTVGVASQNIRGFLDVGTRIEGRRLMPFAG
jgi:hypothetical protein